MARRGESALGHGRDDRHHDRDDDPPRDEGQDDSGHDERDRYCGDNGIMMPMTIIATGVNTGGMSSAGTGPAGLVAATLHMRRPPLLAGADHERSSRGRTGPGRPGRTRQ